MTYNVAVVGATGVVGRAMRSILEEREFPVKELRLMASARSAGTIVESRWGDVVVENLAESDPRGIDIALFSAGASRSREFAPAFAEAGAVVIDNSSAFRQLDGYPLVVAGVNDHAVRGHSGIIANPNCTTMTLMMGIAPLHRAAHMKTMIATSYQAVSGSGSAGIAELQRQNEQLGLNVDLLRDGGWANPGTEVYARPIAWNVLPLAGDMDQDGYTVEEWKLVHETRKILERPDIAVEPTCVRVPTIVGHGVHATAWFDRPMNLAEARELLSEASGIQLWDDPVPTPLDSAGLDDVLVGRVRETTGIPGGISLWTVGDNLRKGAALNTIQIAELLISA